jgi:hypothetical protein
VGHQHEDPGVTETFGDFIQFMQSRLGAFHPERDLRGQVRRQEVWSEILPRERGMLLGTRNDEGLAFMEEEDGREFQ